MTDEPDKKPTAAEERVAKLLKLAEREFGELKEPEIKLFRAVAAGKDVDYRTGNAADDDPAGADDWPKGRALRADRIEWLCTDSEATALVTHRGVWITGARIEGDIDLKFIRMPFPIVIFGSAIRGKFDLTEAEVAGLYLDGTHTGSIIAGGVKVKGSVLLRKKFSAIGEVRLHGASIGGNLECGGGRFINEGAYALNAGGMKVLGSVFLRDGFEARGEVRLPGASIGGNLECKGGRFINKKARALSADGLNVVGDVCLNEGFRSEGEVRLLGASIGGNLDCNDGRFINEGGYALNADGLKVKGDVFLRNCFEARGEVRLPGASIDGDLDCDNGRFINEGAYALNAGRMKVVGSAFLRNRFRAEGLVSLVDATIIRYFEWMDVDSPEKATLDLRSAEIGTLWDEEKSWPSEGNLQLNGLIYTKIGDESPTDAKTRKKWLRLQPDDRFRPQPYEQLAEVLKKEGHEDDAKRILTEKAKAKAKHMTLSLRGVKWWNRLWLRYLGRIIGYGYRLAKEIKFVLAILLIGWFFFGVGYEMGIVTPSREWIYPAGRVNSERVVEKYPVFYAPLYSLDMFIPILDLKQADYFLPDAARGGRLLDFGKYELRTGGLLMGYMWFHILSGWVLTPLFVVGLTRVIRS